MITLTAYYIFLVCYYKVYTYETETAIHGKLTYQNKCSMTKKTQKFYNDQQFYNKTLCGLLNWKLCTKPKYWKAYFFIYIARLYHRGTSIWDRLYNIPYIHSNIYYCLGIVNKRSVTKPWKLQLNILFIAHSVNCITSSMLPQILCISLFSIIVISYET